MQTNKPAQLRLGSRVLALAAALFMMIGVAVVAQPAAAATYVGAELADVKPEDKAVVASPQPVQIIFEFRTKGAPNAQATKFLKAKVSETVRATGFFSEVSEQPVANGAVLSIIIDNVVDPEAMRRAEMQGAVTGATLFLAGSNVTDNYIATVDYVSGPGAAPISRTARHLIITQLGLINSPPVGAVKVGKMTDAVFTMTRQIITNPLNDIAKDAAFAGGIPTPTVETPVQASPAVEAPVEAPAEAPVQAPAEAVPAADPAPHS